ncbi:UNVERIFIED_CONTAM: hypothetical protein Slati_3444200 [Sesamum latifolium]|uniref:Uncharacterized protein n=1 Tax=Sesamum latifolium TaxID=2727402 RepID=A0AAW2UH86_9LAMI
MKLIEGWGSMHQDVLPKACCKEDRRVIFQINDRNGQVLQGQDKIAQELVKWYPELLGDPLSTSS